MVDDFTPQDPSQMPPPGEVPPPVPPEGKPSFLSTTKGKVIVIVGALFGLGIVAAIGVGAFLLFFVNEASDALNEAIQDATSITATSTAGTTEPTTSEPEQVALSDVFTFRDVFEPLIVIVDDEEGVDGPEEYPEVDPDTLYLHDIVVRDDESYAVLIWQSQPGEYPEGAELAGSPWQVLSIGTGDATMLYGDEQVTLIVGQGISTGPATPDDVPPAK